MREKFLKARLPRELYDTLQTRAGEAGQRLGTFVREALERDAQAIDTEQALARIEVALATATPANAPSSAPIRDHELHRDVHELRLLVREIAMHLNAQIVTRVVAQLAAHDASTHQNGSTP